VGFFVVMTSLIVSDLLLALMTASKVASYRMHMLREHFLAIFIAGGILDISEICKPGCKIVTPSHKT
jgi:hypothetical protein